MLTLITHTQWQASDKCLHWAHDSTRGIYMAWNEHSLCAMGFTNSALDAQARILKTWRKANLTRDNTLPRQYLYALKQQTPPPMQVVATEFEALVWSALCTIPSGTTLTYKQLAQHIGKPNAARATGSAVGRNPIAQFIPCHRILPATGGLGGYAWGTQHKTRLLEIEKSKTIAA